MSHKLIGRILASLVLLSELVACAPLKQYRTAYEPCVSPTLPPDSTCETHALQHLPGDNGSTFLLGFVEFDDQGVLWDRRQMEAVLDQLWNVAASKDVLMVVFAHGWKHSAAPGDPNIETFREVLAGLSDAEARLSRASGAPERQVVGIYLGWRGGSLSVPLIKNLTFWERKNTAEKVGHGGVTEVLSRLELIKRQRDTAMSGHSYTRLIVVGHSFGGAVVASALSQILESGFVDTTCPDGAAQCDVAGFGNLVVLINPAFEALSYAPLSDMSTERGRYFESQLPVLAVLTSEADDATRLAFPAGRRLSTFFEKARPMQRSNATTQQQETVDERAANVTALGHFEAYRTHWLYPADERTRDQVSRVRTEDSLRGFLQSSADWANDMPASKIPFDGLVLERTTTSAGRNPYLVVSVDKRLIRDHNDIADPRVINFVKQLILISTHTPQQTEHLRRTIAASGW